MSSRRYEGPALDTVVQYLSEAPYWQGEGETVDVVGDEEVGQETAGNVPMPDGGEADLEGQTTLEDFGGWSV